MSNRRVVTEALLFERGGTWRDRLALVWLGLRVIGNAIVGKAPALLMSRVVGRGATS